MTERPNILWLVSEDNSRFLGCYGDPIARTPRLDAMAAGGIRYTNAYSVAPVCAPSRFSIITGMYPWSVREAENMRTEVDLPTGVRPFPQYLREAGYYCTNAAKTDYNARVDIGATWDECAEGARWQRRAAGQPFFSVVNFMETHESCLFDVAASPSTDPASVRVPAYLPDTAVVRNDIAHYYDHLAALDQQIGAVLDELEADGLAQDTIVVYYSDHGGVLPRSKRFCLDSGLAVPLIVSVPERWRGWVGGAPSTESEPVTLMDMSATALSLAGIPTPAYMHARAALGPHRAPAPALTFGGRDRMDERYDLQRTVRDERYRYVRSYQPDLPAGQHLTYMWQLASMQEWERLATTARLDPAQQQFWGPKPYEALFDLHTDPDEVVNLADDPGHAERLAVLRGALDAHMLAVTDTGLLVEGAPVDPEEPLPLPVLMEVAAAAAAANGTGSFREAATHRHPSVRVWAVRGARARARTHPGADDQAVLQAALADPVPAVRIVACEAVADAAATDALIELLAHEQPPVRLQAANALDRLVRAGRAPEARLDRLSTALRAHAPAGDRYLPRLAGDILVQLDA